MGVASYIAKRVGLFLAVIFIGLTITFILPRLMPVDPVEGYISQITTQANVQMSAEAIAELKSNLRTLESGGAKLVHGSGGIVLLRAA